MNGVVIRRGNCLEILPTLGVSSVDAIITDPPYGTEVKRDGYGRRQKWQGKQCIAGDADLSVFAAAIPQMRRLIRADGWVIFFVSPKRRDDVGAVCRGAELNLLHEIVWDKASPGIGGGIRYQHETILLGSFGVPRGRCGLPSVLREWVPKGQNGHRRQRHVHEKPIGVMVQLIRYATDEGDLVLDPFAGSGTTLVACLKAGRRGLGYEIDEQYISVSQRRMLEAEMPLFEPAMPGLFPDEVIVDSLPP